MRKAIFAGATVLVLSLGTVVLADHGGGVDRSGKVGWSNLAQFSRSEPGHLASGNGILEEVLAEMVTEGTLAQVQSDAIVAALQAKKEEMVEARQQAKEMLESFWEDDILTEDEINQLPFAEQILQMEGVSEALADGQITKAELQELHPGKGTVTDGEETDVMEGGATETLIHFPPLQTGLGDSPPGPVFFVVAFRSVASGQ